VFFLFGWGWVFFGVFFCWGVGFFSSFFGFGLPPSSFPALMVPSSGLP